MLSIAKSRYHLPGQLLFLICNGFGLLLGTIYNIKTPDLYPNNSHHTLGWALTWIILAHSVMAVIRLYAGQTNAWRSGTTAERATFIPASQPFRGEHEQIYRNSNDSGQGTERASSSLHSSSSSVNDIPGMRDLPIYEQGDEEQEKPRYLRGSTIDAYLASNISGRFSSRVVSVNAFLHNLIDRLLLPLGFVAICTGLVTMTGIFVSEAVQVFLYSVDISDVEIAERNKHLQRPSAFHQRRSFRILWRAHSWPMVRLLRYIWLGLERQAAGSDSRSQGCEDAICRVCRIVSNIPLRLHQCLARTSSGLGSAVDCTGF
jgi:Domain of unknown function (DUF2427)